MLSIIQKTLIVLFIFCDASLFADLPLYWWRTNERTSFEGTNFGDELSFAIVERILGKPPTRASASEHKLLAVGSILQFAIDGDVVWGSGDQQNSASAFHFKTLDVRAVRGPLTRQALLNCGIHAPAIYGDPALLLPYLFPEFKRSETPAYDYIIIPHISEIGLFARENNVVWPTEPWQEIVQKITNSKFVISSSLHGLVVAESFGIPARCINKTKRVFSKKYLDYYMGTGRPGYTQAFSVQQALEMGGEPPPIFNAEALLNAFPYEYFLQ